MKIRPMKAADYAEVDRLMQQVHQLHLQARPDLFIPLEHPYSREKFLQMISSPDWICLAAEQNEPLDGQLDGICFVSMRNHTCMVDTRSAYLEDLCVDSRCRHQGIGQALYRHAEQAAREKGAIRFDLMVWPFNEGAIRFYESLGFSTQRLMLEKKLP